MALTVGTALRLKLFLGSLKLALFLTGDVRIMSTFGSWWVSFRDKVEQSVMDIFHALEPSLQVAAMTAVTAGVAAASAKEGTLGDKFVAARNAVEDTAKAIAPSLATDALHAAAAILITTPAPVVAQQAS